MEKYGLCSWKNFYSPSSVNLKRKEMIGHGTLCNPKTDVPKYTYSFARFRACVNDYSFFILGKVVFMYVKNNKIAYPNINVQ